MKCLYCGTELTKQDVCLHCGADVRLYKQIVFTANSYYNKGLELAKHRNLTGAAEALRTCLLLYKNHVDAHNLLGLIYFETGELTLALREWVTSQNEQPEDNLANDYLDRVKKQMHHLSGTVSRYNVAVKCLSQDSRDLTLIQLKTLQKNSFQILAAKQLLALLYMQDGLWSKAEKLLKQAIAIDNQNPKTLRYLEQIKTRKHIDLDGEGSIRSSMKKALEKPVDNDALIPENAREYGSYFVYVLYILMGLVLGAGLIYYIFVPGLRRQILTQRNNTVVEMEAKAGELSNSVVSLNAEISGLKAKLLEMEAESNELRINQQDVNKYQMLLEAFELYVDGNPLYIPGAFDKLKEDPEDPYYQKLYNLLKEDIDKNLKRRYYEYALLLRSREKYENAVEAMDLYMSFYGVNVDGYVFDAECWILAGNLDQALRSYNMILNEFPADEKIAEWIARRDAVAQMILNGTTEPETQPEPENTP